jgi:hypothetical protein
MIHSTYAPGGSCVKVIGVDVPELGNRSHLVHDGTQAPSGDHFTARTGPFHQWVAHTTVTTPRGSTATSTDRAPVASVTTGPGVGAVAVTAARPTIPADAPWVTTAAATARTARASR